MLAETSAEAATRFGSAPAFVTDEGLTLSYAEFDALADEAAVGLAELGVGEGDVVSLLLPSVPEHFVAYVAAARLGALTAAVNPKLVQAERAAVLRAANPLVVVTTEELAPTNPDAPFTTVLIEPARRADAVMDGVRRARERPEPLAGDADRPIAIVFTS
ncbi:MAG: AMP-binding protein, partial [Acidimicrobiales bacterium]|nr:AMP-binding protein [Acidimicrobiales bacterium]